MAKHCSQLLLCLDIINIIPSARGVAVELSKVEGGQIKILETGKTGKATTTKPLLVHLSTSEVFEKRCLNVLPVFQIFQIFSGQQIHEVH